MTASHHDPEDQLCLWIGRVARAHVQLDNALRSVHQTLTAPGLGAYLANSRRSTTGPLVEDCRLMVSKASATEQFTDAAYAALKAAADANDVRNSVVHDMWLRDPNEGSSDAPPRWTVHRAKRGDLHPQPLDTPLDLTFVEHAHMQMRRAVIRVHALVWGLWEVLPAFAGSRAAAEDEPGHTDESAGELSTWIRVMRDDFRLFADGSFSVPPEV